MASAVTEVAASAASAASAATVSASASAVSAPMPTVFLSHGAGAAYFMDVPQSHRFYPVSAGSDTAKWLKAFRKSYGLEGARSPKAIVVVSAHWETSGKVVRVTSQAAHTQLQYDYENFPAHCYQLEYNPPGSPELSKRLVALLAAKGIEAQEDSQWNFDHGVFVPLLMIFPEADTPVVELSIDASWDPAFHLGVGRALAALKHEGVLVVCSGSSTHNFEPDGAANAEFMAALTKIIESDELTPAQREQQGVIDWLQIPSARKAHPVDDHFVPFFVAVGAAEGKRGRKIGEVKAPGGDWVRTDDNSKYVDWHTASFLFE